MALLTVYYDPLSFGGQYFARVSPEAMSKLDPNRFQILCENLEVLPESAMLVFGDEDAEFGLEVESEVHTDENGVVFILDDGDVKYALFPSDEEAKEACEGVYAKYNPTYVSNEKFLVLDEHQKLVEALKAASF